jgi:putative hydrolase of the HAD superfamily
MSKIKAIFCDVNGVLFEQEERFSTRYAYEFGVPIEKLNAYLDNDFDLCLIGKDDLKIRLAELIGSWGWKGTVDELLDYWFGKEVPANMDLIKNLKVVRERGVLLFLATQNEKYKTAKFLELVEPLLDYDYLMATYQIGYKKSNPMYFSSGLVKYGLKPDEVVLIDNNPKAISSAESVGLRAIFFENETQTISELQGLLV